MKWILWIGVLFFGGSSLIAQEPAVEATGEEDSYNACVVCHENLPGRLSEVVVEWKQSIHYKNQVTCDGCHGGDPTVTQNQFATEEEFTKGSHLRRDTTFLLLPPSDKRFISSARGRSVSYFCGKCHATIKEKHLGSPHGDLGSPTCLFCHGRGSHAIGESDLTIIDTLSLQEGGQCATCHRAATMETVANVKTVLTNAHTQLSKATEQYQWLTEQGYKNLAMDKMFHHSKETLSQLRQTFHSFNMQEINNFALAIKDNAELTKQTYEMIDRLETSKFQQAMVGTTAVVFLLGFAGLLLHYRKRCLHSAGSTGHPGAQ